MKIENGGDLEYSPLESDVAAEEVHGAGGSSCWQRLGFWLIFICALSGLSLNLSALGYDCLCTMSLDEGLQNRTVTMKYDIRVGWKATRAIVDATEAGRIASHTRISSLDCDSDPDDTSIEDDQCALKKSGQIWFGFGIVASTFSAAGLLLAIVVLRYRVGTGKILMTVLGTLLLFAGALVLASVVIYELYGYSELEDVARNRPVLNVGDLGGAVKQAVFFTTALGTSWLLSLLAAILLLIGGAGGFVLLLTFAKI